MPHIQLQPVFRATLAKRTASSACHAAKLNPGPQQGMFICQACGKPCRRVLSTTEIIEAGND